MTRRLLCAAVLTAFAAPASDDAARYKPKTYAPGKSLRDGAYRAAAYAPASDASATAKRAPAATAPSRWKLFGSDAKSAPDKRLEQAPAPESERYRQEQQISVPTIPADARDIPEKKPFVEKGDKLDDKTFTPGEHPRDKNPLLAPRQGIKAPE